MRIITLLFVSLLLSFNVKAQQILLAKWTFPTGNPTDSLADGGIATNLSRAINTGGGASVIDYTTNGYTTKAAKATNWDNGMDTKYWIIDVSTVGYDTVTLSSMQQSGGANPGPRDFKVQYKAGGSGSWTDLPGTTLVLDNGWTAVLNNVQLPSSCWNKNHVYIRWIMTSNTSSANGTILPTGISKIDEIYVYGKVMSGINEFSSNINITVSPNPVKDKLSVSTNEKITSISVYNVLGNIVMEIRPESANTSIDMIGLNKGLYFLKISLPEHDKPCIRKIIVD
jgi:hypothetical protein